MENKFMRFVNESKWFVVFFLIWTFIQILLLYNGTGSYGFWPFYDFPNDIFYIDDYGSIEFFVYETVPLLIFVVNKLVGKDIKKAIGKNN